MSAKLQPIPQDIASKKANTSEISCMQRILMVFCPCTYFNEPNVATQDCCLCCHEIPLQDVVTIPPLVELSGTYIGRDPIPKWFIFLRAFISIFMVYILVFNVIFYVNKGNPAGPLMYFTQWTHFICTISMVVKMYSTYKVYTQVGRDKLGKDGLLQPITSNAHPFWRLYLWNSVLVQISVPAVGLISLNYFWLVCEWKWKTPLSAYNSVQIHGGNFVLVWLDFLLSAQRMYYKSVCWPWLFVIIYTVWTIIFEAFVKVTPSGHHYLYTAADWSEGIAKPLKYFFVSIVVIAGFVCIATFVKNTLLICSKLRILRSVSVSGVIDPSSDESDRTEVDALL